MHQTNWTETFGLAQASTAFYLGQANISDNMRIYIGQEPLEDINIISCHPEIFGGP